MSLFQSVGYLKFGSVTAMSALVAEPVAGLYVLMFPVNPNVFKAAPLTFISPNKTPLLPAWLLNHT